MTFIAPFGLIINITFFSFKVFLLLLCSPHLFISTAIAKKRNSTIQTEGTKELKELQKFKGLTQGPVAELSWSKFANPNNKSSDAKGKPQVIKGTVVPSTSTEVVSPNSLIPELSGINLLTPSLTQIVFYQNKSLTKEVQDNKRALGESYAKLLKASDNCSKKITEYKFKPIWLYNSFSKS